MSRASTLILEPHKPLGGFLGMMGAPSYGRNFRRIGSRHKHVGMAGAVPGAAANLSASQMSTAGGGGTPIVFAPNPDAWSFSDDLYSMATGDVSPTQQAALIQSEQTQLVQAGADPATAQAQAQADVNAALTSYVGPGAFGVITTGAAPGQGLVASLGSGAGSLFDALGISSIPGWAWLAIGGVGILVLVKAIK